MGLCFQLAMVLLNNGVTQTSPLQMNFYRITFFTKLIPPNLTISCNAVGCILALGFTGLITYVL